MTFERRSRLDDVARDAGVSLATVSRAMTRPELVRATTLARVRSSAQKLGYIPGGVARALVSGKSMTVGAIVPTLDSAIFAKTLQAMQSTLSQAGYLLLVASTNYNNDAEVEAIRGFLARGVDGLFLVGAERSRQASDLLRNAMVPVTLGWCADPLFDAVTVDNHLAGALAARHLLDLGHRNIGMIAGQVSSNDRQRKRVEGARATLLEYGVALPEWLVSEQPLTLAGGRQGCAVLMSAAHPPTAIIGGNDILAIGCITELQLQGISVPQGLSVVGIDNLELAAHVTPPMTTIHLPTGRIGEQAALSLLRRMANPGPPQEIELPVELVIRKSTEPLST
ncbi:MAG: substrate-binding domain-containing protein [Hyphomicrobiales bacterium]|nr:substrate-binding domain-containing protein [Hyphomicrobiales bacterium]MDE2114465.1 substrate-binding domain-containing protein [Hyphomicrobiales bacterium]